MKNITKIALLALSVFYISGCFIVAPAWAQQSPESSRIETEKQSDIEGLSRLGRRTTEVFKPRTQDITAPASPGDDALGQQYLLKRKQEYEPFSVFGNIAGNWTSNVALTKNNPQSDNYIVTTAGVSYQPIIRPNLLGEITFVQQWFRYDKFTDMNFDSMNAGAGLSYAVPELSNLAVFGRYNYNRLTNADGVGEYFRNHSITLGFFKMFPLARTHYLYGGYSSQFGFSDPKIYQRDYHSAVAGYNIDITPKLSVDVSIRFSYIPYQEDGREDYNESVSLGITYKPKPWLMLTFSSFAASNQSKNGVFEYNVVNLAPNIGIKIKF
jgi:opacity protein-like surface antigen